jgi:hypothetical protein
LARRKGIVEKNMFGGIAFMLHGNMLVGVWKDSMIVRLGPEQGEKALAEPIVTEFDVTGRPMTGWVVFEPDGIENDAQLASDFLPHQNRQLNYYRLKPVGWRIS